MTCLSQRCCGVLLALTVLTALAPHRATATDLSISKEASSTTVAVGDRFTYTLTVDNSSTAGGGPFDSPNTIAIDNMPSALKIIAAVFGTANTPCTIDGQMIRCDLGALPKNNNVTVTITVEACEAGVVTNNANVSGGLSDPNTGNNASAATVTVVEGLSVTKTASSDEVLVGNTVDFTITVTKGGSSEATGVFVDDWFNPSNWAYVSDTGGCQPNGTAYRCDIGTLAPGASHEFIFTLRLLRTDENSPLEVEFSTNSVTARDDRGASDTASARVRVKGLDPFFFILLVPGSRGDQHVPKRYGSDLLDLYLGDERLADDLAPGQATGYVRVFVNSLAPTLYLVDSNALDRSAPLDSVTLNLLAGEPGDEALALRSLHILTTNAAGAPLLLTRLNPRTEAADPNRVDFLLAHADPATAAFDLRRLDDTPAHTLLETLARNVAFASFSEGLTLDPVFHNLDLVASDGTEPLGVFRMNLGQHAGQMLTLAATSAPADNRFTLAAYDTSGTMIETSVVTAAEEDATLPAAFVLRGNYPNPFNPTTTIGFDLPETADVRIDVVDTLGRRVLALPVETLQAGFNHKQHINASALASGIYLYRVHAQTPTRTLVQTGQMVVLK